MHVWLTGRRWSVDYDDISDQATTSRSHSEISHVPKRQRPPSTSYTTLRYAQLQKYCDQLQAECDKLSRRYDELRLTNDQSVTIDFHVGIVQNVSNMIAEKDSIIEQQNEKLESTAQLETELQTTVSQRRRLECQLSKLKGDNKYLSRSVEIAYKGHEAAEARAKRAERNLHECLVQSFQRVEENESLSKQVQERDIRLEEAEQTLTNIRTAHEQELASVRAEADGTLTNMRTGYGQELASVRAEAQVLRSKLSAAEVQIVELGSNASTCLSREEVSTVRTNISIFF